MSVNDPDGESYQPLTFDEFVAHLVSSGWRREVAEQEWENFDKPVYLCDLRW